MAQPTLNVRDANADTQVVNTINPNGQAAMVDSQPVVIASNQTDVPTAMVQKISTSTLNTSDVPLASGASFTGGAERVYGVAGFQVNAKSDQPLRIQVQQSGDGINWDIDDVYEIPPDIGYGRTVQCTSEWIRVIITNLGSVTTDHLRVKCALCPTVEALPRMLTPRGRLALSTQTTGDFPNPASFTTFGTGRALLIDADRNLVTRSAVVTDESSFRDDFVGTDIESDLTGTCYFRNGETHITGIGTSFTSELIKGHYIRLTGDDYDYRGIVEDVYSDTDMVLQEGYGGSTGSGTAKAALWDYHIGLGSTITKSNSEIYLSVGTEATGLARIQRQTDYPPLMMMAYFDITHRYDNQETIFGFVDDIENINTQAVIVLNGTDDTKVTLRTSNTNADIEETEVTLPYGRTTDEELQYRIKASLSGVALYIEGVRMAEHSKHTPGPYDSLNVCVQMSNSDIPAGEASMNIDVIYLANYNELDVNFGNSVVRTQDIPPVASSCTNVSAAIADTVLLAENRLRRGCTVYNDSTSPLYLKFGSGASASSFTVRLLAQDYYEAPFSYVGAINGYWAAANGAARITELENAAISL